MGAGTADLSHLLEQLGLTQYESVLAAEDVDLDALRRLDDDDLRRLGLSLGHRRKLIAAAKTAVLFADSRASADRVAASTRGPEIARAAAGGERRQITVLFCDLVGSTELSSRFDPEQVGQLFLEFQNAATGIVARFGGHLDRFVGDGMLAFFGYPQAHEDAAERAVRAAIAIADAVAQVRTPDGQALAVRAGAASGLVFIDHRPSRGGEQLVAGEVLNVAARLQQCAKPGSVIVAAATHQLIAGVFESRHLGPQFLKGFSAPLPAWEVLAERSAETRFEAQHAETTSPAVGRVREIGALLDRWELAKAGEGQVVLLSGEAGIGKSRISAALRERIADEVLTVIRLQCSPFHSNSPLYPAIVHLSHAAGLERGDSIDDKLDKIERLLCGSAADGRQAVPILAALLSVPSGSRYPELALSAEQLMRRTLEIFVSRLATLSSERPVLLVVEDAHWIDPTTRELLTLVIDRARTARILAVVTFRPDFQHDWGELPHVMILTLSRLARGQIIAMVEQIADAPLPPELIDQIVARTDGVPLFVEELTKAVLESGIGSGPAIAAHHPVIPTTLQDSLLARLDHLPGSQAREVAQIGALIGREFSYRLLAAVAQLPPDTLAAALGQLVQAGLVHQRGTPPNALYIFKHALVQDTAYNTLVIRRRQELHARCAEALKQEDPELAETQPELLAYHCGGADMAEAAIEHWLAAGRRAATRSANLEAIGHFANALAGLPRLADADRRDRLEMDIQVGLGMPLIAVKGYGARETGAAWARVRELAERRGDTDHLISSLYGSWAYDISLGQFDTALKAAARLQDLGRERQDDGIVLVAHRITGLTRHTMGDQDAARAEFETALEKYDPRRHQSLAFQFGQDQRVAALAFLGATRWLQGFPDQAVRIARTCVDQAQKLDHANSFAYALAWGACPVFELCGDIAELDRLATLLLDYAKERALGRWHACGLAYRGLALVERGEFVAGLKLQQQALTTFRNGGAGLRDTAHLGYLARSWGLAESAGEGLRLIDEALDRAQSHDEGWNLPELLRIKGDLVLAVQGAHGLAAAEALFERALDISRGQKTRAWALRAATSLARLWRDDHREAAARALLSETYAGFSEGFETADLRAARDLLAELGG
jgi:class 3 adenylate cyclase